jgi:hypothetical protein
VLDVALLGYIACYKDCFAACRVELSGEVLSDFRLEIPKDQPGAGSGEVGAVVRPMPEAAPVMTTTFPVKS